MVKTFSLRLLTATLSLFLNLGGANSCSDEKREKVAIRASAKTILMISS